MNPPIDGLRPLAEIELDAIEHAIRVTGSVDRAAMALRIGAATIYRRLRRKREASRG